MSHHLFSIRSLSIVATTLAVSTFAGHAQDVAVAGSLTDTPLGGGVYAYSVTLQNTGIEAVQSLWLGWTVGNFDIANPSNPSSSLGWSASLSGNSIQFAGTAGTALAPGNSALFAFDSTSTPTQFQNGTAGPSVAYGVNASQFAIENTSLHSFEFTPRVVPEPSTLGLLGIGSLGLLSSLRRKRNA